MVAFDSCFARICWMLVSDRDSTGLGLEWSVDLDLRAVRLCGMRNPVACG